MAAPDGAVPPRRPLGALWGLVPLLSLGLLGWLPYALWATAHRGRGDTAAALGYAVGAVAVLVLADRPGAEDAAAVLLVALVVAGTGHTAATGARRPPPRCGNRAPEAARDRAARREKARRLLEREPQVARELRIGRPDLRRSYDDGGLLDMNGVPATVLVRELGWTEAEATGVIAARDRVGGFSGPTELVALTGIARPRVDAATPRLVFSTA